MQCTEATNQVLVAILPLIGALVGLLRERSVRKKGLSRDSSFLLNREEHDAKEASGGYNHHAGRRMEDMPTEAVPSIPSREDGVGP